MKRHLYPGSVYLKLKELAELEHLWKHPVKIYDYLTENGYLSHNTEKIGAVACIRNQVAFLGEIKAIFNKNKSLRDNARLEPTLATPPQERKERA